MFIDDNLTQDRGYAMDLFRGLMPLKKIWVTQVSVEVADDLELLGAMRRAGCIGVFIGLESFSDSALCSQNKVIKAPSCYQEAVRRFHEHGMYVEAGLIFGFDTDTAGIFRSTLDILDQIGIDLIQASILTPLPGTVLFETMKHRITDRDWAHYDYQHVVFRPKQISAKDLQAGYEWLNKQYYRPPKIIRRLVRWLGMPGGWRNAVYPLFLNIAYWGRQIRFRYHGYDPAIFADH